MRAKYSSNRFVISALVLVAGSVPVFAGTGAKSAPLPPAALRDPTSLPSAALAPSTARAPSIESFRPEQIITIDGRYYAIWQAKRYAVGDRTASGKIERISDAEVWIRHDEGLRKIALYKNVEKREVGSLDIGKSTEPPAKMASKKGREK